MHADVIVVGLGAMGAATAWQLAQRGARVLGIDRHAPPHDFGSSQGLTRITRLAVGEGAEYVPLVQRAHTLWREIEAATGTTLMRTTGGLVIGRRHGGAGMHGQDDFVASTLAVARQHGIAHELLDPATARQRFPPFALRDDEHAFFEPSAGVLFPEACIGAQLRLAREQGATLRCDETVLSIERDGAALAVRTGRETHHAAQVVVTAGAWLPGLLGGRYAQTLRVQRQTLHWLRPTTPEAFAPERCPVFIWAHGPTHADAFYGIPLADGTGGVKVGTQQHEVDTDPDSLDREVTAAETTALFTRHLHGRVLGLSDQRVRAAACLYTVAPDARFIIERHPQTKGLSVVSACSGHGFKHSAALGEALATQVLEGRSGVDLAPFGWR